MSIASAVQTAQKSNKTESTSGKNPAYYAKQKQAAIDEMCESPVTEVRIHAAGSAYVPVNNLKQLLKTEQDRDVLSVLLMNDRVPIKALEEFSETEACEQFTAEDEAYSHVLGRLAASKKDAAASSTDDNGDGDDGDDDEDTEDEEDEG